MKEFEQKINIYKVPEFSEKFFVRDIQQFIWHMLSEYKNESFSKKFIESQYKLNRFGNRNYSEIASFFSFNIRQGIEYFQSSLASSLAIRPLLLYYGIMSFAKAIITLNNPNYLKKLRKRKNRHHGLFYNSKKSKKFFINNDTVAIKAPGTFNFFQEALYYPSIPGNSEFALKKLYSWMIGFSLIDTDVYIPGKKFDQYLDPIPIKTNTKLCKKIKKNKKGISEGEILVEVSIPINFLSVQNPKKNIKEIIREFTGFKIISCNNENIILRGLVTKFKLDDDNKNEFIATKKVLWKLNKISYFDGRDVYFFQRLKGEDFLAQPIVYYLISYILGSICRYEPAKWIKTLEAKRTNERWLVELALNEITHNFLLFVILQFREGLYPKFILK